MNGYRPVYVLGAGFSKAVNSAMPIADELGMEVADRLPDIDFGNDVRSASFEDWLSVRVTPLPFLEGWRNTQRQAEAQQILAQIATILDERTQLASVNEAPDWLIQLIYLWSMEKAIILTFNYDTLVERAINDHPPVSLEGGQFRTVYADELVFPAPPATAPIYYADQTPEAINSMQILKLHGSLNWYWSAGSEGALSLTRLRERGGYGGRTLIGGAGDPNAISMLDRFLVPPVSVKNEYYSPNILNRTWRTAYEALKSTRKLVLMGYSMPATDSVGTELLSSIGGSADVLLVDRTVGEAANRRSLYSRASQLNGKVAESWEGEGCIGDFVQDQLSKLPAINPVNVDGPILAAFVMVLNSGERLSSDSAYYVLRMEAGVGVTAEAVSYFEASRSPMPPAEYAVNSNHSHNSNIGYGDYFRVEAVPEAFKYDTDWTVRLGALHYKAVRYSSGMIGGHAVIFLDVVPIFN